MFMENAAEIPVEEQICRKPALKNVLEEINAQLGELDHRFTKRAWHLPVKVVAAMEDAVMDLSLGAVCQGICLVQAGESYGLG